MPRVWTVVALAVGISLIAVGVALASSGGAISVPDSAASVLAPMGIAAVIYMQRKLRTGSRRENANSAYAVSKRSIDIAVASVILLGSLPLICVLAALIKLDGPGPVFFRRKVIGKYGKSFDMYKLRTMVVDAESILHRDQALRELYFRKCKLEQDPRVTRLGKLLRKTSLDELPQFVNVLQGTMTLVGPRPIHQEELELYGPEVERFMSVTPGITGLWQVSGRSDTTYDWRVRLDMRYVDERCLKLDLSILLKTIAAVLHRHGAH